MRRFSLILIVSCLLLAMSLPMMRVRAPVLMYPSDGDSWTESTDGWGSGGGSLTASPDSAVGEKSLHFTYVGMSYNHRYFHRLFSVVSIDNTYELKFWHKGDSIRWALSDQYKSWQFYFHRGDVKNGWTGEHEDWTLITVDLSHIPPVDPDVDVDKDGDDFYDIEGIVFGGWASGTDVYVDGLHFEKTEDTTPPQYFDDSTNSTWAGTPVEFRLRWTDNVGLSGYIFSFDNGSGTFTNDTWAQWPISSREDWSNVTKIVNSEIGKTISWKIYANDTSNNWNPSQTYSFVTTEIPPPAILSVDTTPVKGEVFVNDVSWGIAPQARTLPEGTYTVSFGDVSGYVTPAPQSATVVAGETTSVLGTYESVGEGTLSVDTSPVKGEVFVDGISWGVAPQTNNVTAGTHMVSFGGVAGYFTPDPLEVTLAKGENKTVVGIYEEIPPVLMYPSDGDSWTESTDGWGSGGGSLTTSVDSAVGGKSLSFAYGGTDYNHRYFYRLFSVASIDNTYEFKFWHKGDSIKWALSDQYKSWQFYFHRGDVKSGWTGEHGDWTLITVDLSDIPPVDPDVDVDKDGDDFYDIEGIVFGGWTDGTDAYVDGLHFEKTEDTTPPHYSDSSTNSTWAGTPVEFRLRWTDNVGLSGYTFSLDNGLGAFTNDTWVQWPISSRKAWSNVTKVVNSEVGKTISWKIYANDTSNNWNPSQTYSFVTTEIPPTVLTVDTTPVKGKVFVNGVSWGTAPQTNTVTPGTYTVGFGDVADYVTPDSQIVTLAVGESRTVVGEYEEEEGTLSVDTTPVKGEVFVDGVNWGIAPQSRTVPVGDHTVSFGDFLGYLTPPPQSATVVTGETTSILGTYEPAPGTGTLSVDTTPVKGEVFVNGESWGIAPQTKRLPEGTYTVSFGDVTGYEKPSPQDATVVADTDTSVTGIYEIKTVTTVVTTWEYPFEGTPRGIVEDIQSGIQWELHNFFFLDSENNIVQVFPDLDRFIKWTIPTPNSGASFGIHIMNLRKIFFTEPDANKIGELISDNRPSPFIEWTLPPSTSGQSKPYDIVIIGTGAVYFTDIDGDRIGQLSTNANGFTMWSLPSGRQPSGITRYGEVIYFLESDRIARFDPATNTLTEWIVPSSFGSWSGYISASQGFLFVTSEDGNKIGRFDPSTSLFTEWTVPTSNGAPKDMWISARDPSLRAYFVESGSGKMGLLLDTSSGGTETLLSFTSITLDSSSVTVTPDITMVEPTVVTVPRTITEVDGVVDGSFIEWPLPVPPLGLEALAPSTLRLYFTHNSGIVGRFQLVVNTISEWTLPETVNPQKLIEDGEESVFFTESDNKIGKLDGLANTLTEWTLPSDGNTFAISQDWRELGPVIFFTEESANKIARFDPATNTLTEWTVPTPDSRPRGIFVTGSFVYFAEYGANKIGRLDLNTNTFTEWTIPTAASGTTYVTWLSGKGVLAFTETNANKIGFLNPSTNTFTEWVIPTADSFPTDLVQIQGGYLYFAESGSNKIGRMSVYSWGTVFEEWTLPTINPDGPDAISSMYRSVMNLFFTEATSNKIAFFDPSLSPHTTHMVEPTTTAVAPTTAIATPVETTLTPQIQTVSFTWTTVIGMATDGLVEWEVPTAASKPFGIVTTERGEFFTESGAHKIGRLYIQWIQWRNY